MKNKPWQMGVVLVAAAAAVASVHFALAETPSSPPATSPTTRRSTPPPAAKTNTAEARGHYAKARELYDAKKYDDAKAEVDQALALDPALDDAKILRDLINKKLGTAATPGTDNTSESATTESATSQPSGGPLIVPVLTEEQVNKIRFFEVSPDESIQGTIPRKTLEDFWNNVVVPDPNNKGQIDREARDRFMQSSNFGGQLAKMRELNANKYADKIRFTTDPKDILKFKNDIQPMILQNCATSGCHGGLDVHAFKLYGSRGVTPNPREAYTNFYLLSTYKAKDGSRLIDRDRPRDSLFVQYLLHKSQAKFLHPGDKGPKAIFSGEDDPKFLAAVDWVKTLRFPLVDYGITPGAKPAKDAPKVNQ